MLRRAFGLLVTMTISTLFACKARNPEASAVKTEDGTGAALDLREFFTRFEKDVAEVEATYQIAGDFQPQRVEGLALADNNQAVAAGARLVAQKLRALSKETPPEKRVEVDSLAVELEAFAVMLDANLPGVDVAEVGSAVARAQNILDNPPQADGKPGTDPAPEPEPRPEPQPQPEPQIDYDNLTCASYGNGTVPQVVDTKAYIGAYVFQTPANCTNSVRNVRHGMVCAISDKHQVSPYVIRTNTRFGPELGYNQTNNCIRAMQIATSSHICLVDNAKTGASFAKYEVATGKPVDWWFYTVDKCMAGDKSVDARTQCLENASSEWDRCKARVQYYPKDDQTGKRLDCMLAYLKQQERC